MWVLRKGYLESTHPLMKIFFLSMIIKAADFYFAMNKGTFTFDVNLKSGNKSIGA